MNNRKIKNAQKLSICATIVLCLGILVSFIWFFAMMSWQSFAITLCSTLLTIAAHLTMIVLADISDSLAGGNEVIEITNKE